MRRVMAVISVVALLSLMAYSYLEHDEKDPDMNYILTNHEKFEGKEINFCGRAEEINDSCIKLKLMEAPYTYINVTGVDAGVKKGDVVEVLGTLKGVDEVKAEKVFVIKKLEYSLIFIRSLPAIPFVLYLFFKKWRFNFKKFMFEEVENA